MKKIKRFSLRLINFIRPKPRFVPIEVSDVLKDKEGLDVVNRFNDFYYSSGVSRDLNWLGAPMIKNPCDLWMIIELFQKIRPSVIIETGTHHGASASFYADMLNVLGITCDVITVDINPKWNFEPQSKKIHSIVGYSTDQATFLQVESKVKNILSERPGNVIVMLDSDHSEENVSAELALYSKFVSINSYLIVEDTNVNGHPSAPTHGPGPWEAAEKFIAQNANFQRDLDCQRFLLTFNPSGWLKRIN